LQEQPAFQGSPALISAKVELKKKAAKAAFSCSISGAAKAAFSRSWPGADGAEPM
jgi:hypothetical protein